MLRWMAHHGFRPHHDILEFIRLLFTRIGDTKAIEESHRIGRNLEKQSQQRDVLEPAVFFSAVENWDTIGTQAHTTYSDSSDMLTRHESIRVYRPGEFLSGPRFMLGMG